MEKELGLSNTKPSGKYAFFNDPEELDKRTSDLNPDLTLNYHVPKDI
jgi:hypothetical protein